MSGRVAPVRRAEADADPALRAPGAPRGGPLRLAGRQGPCRPPPIRRARPEFREEVAEMMIDTSRAVAGLVRIRRARDHARQLGLGLPGKHNGEAAVPLTLNERARLSELERKSR